MFHYHHCHHCVEWHSIDNSDMSMMMKKTTKTTTKTVNGSIELLLYFLWAVMRPLLVHTIFFLFVSSSAAGTVRCERCGYVALLFGYCLVKWMKINNEWRRHTEKWKVESIAETELEKAGSFEERVDVVHVSSAASGHKWIKASDQQSFSICISILRIVLGSLNSKGTPL